MTFVCFSCLVTLKLICVHVWIAFYAAANIVLFLKSCALCICVGAHVLLLGMNTDAAHTGTQRGYCMDSPLFTAFLNTSVFALRLTYSHQQHGPCSSLVKIHKGTWPDKSCAFIQWVQDPAKPKFTSLGTCIQRLSWSIPKEIFTAPAILNWLVHTSYVSVISPEQGVILCAVDSGVKMSVLCHLVLPRPVDSSMGLMIWADVIPG